MAAGPQTLEELYRKAQTDVAGERAGAAVEWAFLHAKARGRYVVAERHLMHIEGRTRDAYLRSLGCGIEAWAEAINKDAPSPQQMTGAQELLSEAAEWVSATETVMALLASRPARAAVPAAKPATAPRFGVQKGGKA